METIRKPFQGVGNIVRFNWHFYVAVVLLCVGLYALQSVVATITASLFTIAIVLIVVVSGITLAVSYYVYDWSGLYRLDWLPGNTQPMQLLNVHAGFDETSALLTNKYPGSSLTVLDFYDPSTHTELSIRRARKAYPAFPGTIPTRTGALPCASASIDRIFVIFAAHEIRQENERVIFFRELKRVLKPGGDIYVTEHLRDLPNFIAYNIGFVHFLGKQDWYRSFAKAGLTIQSAQKINPFITTFILTHDGAAT